MASSFAMGEKLALGRTRLAVSAAAGLVLLATLAVLHGGGESAGPAVMEEVPADAVRISGVLNQVENHVMAMKADDDGGVAGTGSDLISKAADIAAQVNHDSISVKGIAEGYTPVGLADGLTEGVYDGKAPKRRQPPPPQVVTRADDAAGIFALTRGVLGLDPKVDTELPGHLSVTGALAAVDKDLAVLKKPANRRKIEDGFVPASITDDDKKPSGEAETMMVEEMATESDTPHKKAHRNHAAKKAIKKAQNFMTLVAKAASKKAAAAKKAPVVKKAPVKAAPKKVAVKKAVKKVVKPAPMAKKAPSKAAKKVHAARAQESKAKAKVKAAASVVKAAIVKTHAKNAAIAQVQAAKKAKRHAVRLAKNAAKKKAKVLRKQQKKVAKAARKQKSKARRLKKKAARKARMQRVLKRAATVARVEGLQAKMAVTEASASKKTMHRVFGLEKELLTRKLRNHNVAIDARSEIRQGLPKKRKIQQFHFNTSKKAPKVTSPFQDARQREHGRVLNKLRRRVSHLQKKLIHLRQRAADHGAETTFEVEREDAEAKLARLRDADEDQIELSRMPKAVRAKFQAAFGGLMKQKRSAWKAGLARRLNKQITVTTAAIASDKKSISHIEAELATANKKASVPADALLEEPRSPAKVQANLAGEVQILTKRVQELNKEERHTVEALAMEEAGLNEVIAAKVKAALRQQNAKH